MSLTQLPPYSYILSEAELRLDKFYSKPDEISRLTLPCGRYFHHDTSLAASLCEDRQNGAYVLIAGFAVDLVSNTADLAKISENLLTALAVGKIVFLDYVDFLAGRFIVIYKEHQYTSPHIMGDATNMLKINYSSAYRLCSSNIFLIDDLANSGTRDFREEYSKQRRLWKYGSLGNLSPINKVKILTANHELALDSYDQRRFFPRAPISTTQDAGAASDKIFALSQQQQTLLRSDYFLFNSLSAGLDSRYSLALSHKDHRDQQIYFAYLLEEAHYIDARISSRIASRLNLNHHVLLANKERFQGRLGAIESDLIDIKVDRSLVDYIRRWDWYGHGVRLVNGYKFNLVGLGPPHLKSLLIRSNILEIGRLLLDERNRICKLPEEILKISRRTAWAMECPEIFDKFYKETAIDFDAVHGHNLIDIFYWEHSCSTWVSEILQGTDFALNTHSFANCRKILEIMLSVDFDQRANASIFTHSIMKHLPEIADIPVNPRNV